MISMSRGQRGRQEDRKELFVPYAFRFAYGVRHEPSGGRYKYLVTVTASVACWLPQTKNLAKASVSHLLPFAEAKQATGVVRAVLLAQVIFTRRQDSRRGRGHE